MNCSTCGTPLAPGVSICPNCGTQLSRPVAAPPPPPPAPSYGAAPVYSGGAGVPVAGAQPQNSTLAIVSLVAGIASFLCIPFVSAIVAIITGHMAKGEIRRSGGRLGGDSLGVWGLILGYANIVLSCLGTIFFGFLGAMAEVANRGG